MTRPRWLAVLLAAAFLLAACGGASSSTKNAAGGSGAASSAAATSTPSSAPATSPTSASSSPASSGSSTDASGAATEPWGGTSILGHVRVVADYGAAGAPALGVLGDGSPDQAAAAVQRRARLFARFGEPVLPAMELLATVAQASPGPDGDYSSLVPKATISRYLDAAHQRHMMLVLDLQPGRASFAAQVKLIRPFLADPSVGLGLDPEWKIGPGEVPAEVIGSDGSGDINATLRYVSALVRQDQLPTKLVLIHQFRTQMLPDRSKITAPAGVQVVFHADGFGTPEVKKHVFHGLHFPGRPFGVGFKLFLHHSQDNPRMSPAAVMALRPRPDVVTYE